MSGSDTNTEWTSELYRLLADSNTDDESTIEFIEEIIPDEGVHHDYKQEMYISSQSAEQTKERKSEFIKYCCAFANVPRISQHRFLFVGFDDSGMLNGIQYYNQNQGDHILDVDDSRLQDILSEYLDPVPELEIHDLNSGGDRGGVVVIKRVYDLPVVVTDAIRKNDGSEFIIEGQAFIRQGSQTVLMDSGHFRQIMGYRENLIGEKIQEFADDLGQVVGISTDDLEQMNLSVTSDPNAPAVRDVVTPNQARDIDQELNARMKLWNTTGDLPSEKDILYRFYNNRDRLTLDDDKREYLLRSSLANYIPGTEWLLGYSGHTDDLLESILSDMYNHWTILMLEKLLLVIGNEHLLDFIKNSQEMQYSDSKAEEYTGYCNREIDERLYNYVDRNIRFGSDSYATSELLSDQDTADTLLDDVVMSAVNGSEPNHKIKSAIRQVELVRLCRIA